MTNNETEKLLKLVKDNNYSILDYLHKTYEGFTERYSEKQLKTKNIKIKMFVAALMIEIQKCVFDVEDYIKAVTEDLERQISFMGEKQDDNKTN